MKWSDIAISFILVGISVYIFYETNFYPEPIVPGAPGATLFPRVLAGSLLCLSAVLFVQGVRGGTGAQKGLTWLAVGKILLSLGLAVLFWALLSIWDIFILMPLLLASIMVIMGEKRIRTIIAVPIIFDIFIYVVFYRIFGVMLPTIYF